MRRRALMAAAALLGVAPAAAEEPPLASEDELAEARTILVEWTQAFQAGDYAAQWRLTDRRIRRWHDRERWRGSMRKAAIRNGALLSFSVEAAAPATAADLPCTEQKHCFRGGVKYALFAIRSDYEKAEPPQPEFAVMAWSDDGWRFGGGTFLNRPLGETAVIMTRQDEERYRPGASIRR